MFQKEACAICWEEFSAPEMFEVAGCLHSFCLDCMRNSIAVSLGQWGTAVKCPGFGCNSVLLAKDCHNIANHDQIALMIQREEEDKIHVLDRVYCPNPTCSFLMSKGSLGASQTQTGASKCLKCSFTFCIKCNTKWHAKMTCVEFLKSKDYKKSQDALFEAASRTLGWKKCQNCQSTVERIEGCNHITCSRCKHEFCYTCGAPCIKKKATCKCNI
ncbi:hypothetical protein ARALYDRAFT_901526 [Arabidopsis lyrata subsp. lyrata]|uniref:RBR-type E3 ubiquitin transferase n=1 Tax=Arabidopsis lyrata subsp. lyrata TaxID=81972 RepID=D7LFG9_ARALL|nr:E3 ubiquitin-protein ligase dbl4 [Arabidopsis lyrata subsp. lyrata]EFH57122.1 hypothetical protein ARALYDRAFT_901526 [Arabidopsis lyrata subsp. lyrata]|eukprot:XP_002880863.1 E3 ubiquitin-protein ligase dbl4 [Arabidopsis lyrata subsp. lyrata]